MKNTTTRTLILAAAALTVSVTTAFAQNTTRLKAEIPFSFHIGNQAYPAGTYEASVLGSSTGTKVLKIVNVETGNPRIAMATNNVYPKNSASEESGARLVFRCVDSDCALSQVWPGNSDTGMQFRTPPVKSGEPMHLAVIRLRTASAD